MTDPDRFPMEGGCACGATRYRMASAPMFVHCCHCRWCQRETGSAFALNAIIEADRLTLLQGAPDIVDAPSESGKGQKIARCPHCRVALWSRRDGGAAILPGEGGLAGGQPDALAGMSGEVVRELGG